MSAAAAASLAAMPTAHAQSSSRPKPIYDEDDSESVAPAAGTVDPSKLSASSDKNLTKTGVVNGVTVRSNDTIEEYVSSGRKWLHTQATATQKTADATFDSYLAAERAVASTVADLKADSEDLLPSGLYVLVAALSGSVFTRRSNVLFRGLAPFVFGAAAFKYFLPQTYANTGALLWKFEQKAPALVDAHVKTQKQIDGLVDDVQSTYKDGKQALESGVASARQFVADSTGLQVSSKPKKE